MLVKLFLNCNTVHYIFVIVTSYLTLYASLSPVFLLIYIFKVHTEVEGSKYQQQQ